MISAALTNLGTSLRVRTSRCFILLSNLISTDLISLRVCGEGDQKQPVPLLRPAVLLSSRKHRNRGGVTMLVSRSKDSFKEGFPGLSSVHRTQAARAELWGENRKTN